MSMLTQETGSFSDDTSTAVTAAFDGLGVAERATVLGVGIDIESVDRWRSPGLRLESLFSTSELEYCRSRSDPAVHLAGFWCAKEAVFKAVSQHLSVSLRDIVITHRVDGSLVVEIKGRASPRVLVSISHTRKTAAAVALFV